MEHVMSGLIGRTALVTGGTSGIGRATVLALAKAGANVVFTGRRRPEGEQVAEEAKRAGAAHGVKVQFVAGDVTDEKHVEHAVRTAEAITGKLNFALNNAGLEWGGIPVAEANTADFHKIFDINVLGVMLSMKHEIRAMMRAGGGSIVNTSSVAGSIGMANTSIYIASKHAVNGLTKSAALEVAKNNIRINTVSPAAIDTDMMDRFTGGRSSEMLNYLTNLHPIGRVGKPDEIANPVLFLFSDAASFMTGHDLKVDGGLTVP